MTDTAVRVISGLAEAIAADRTDGQLLDSFVQRRDHEAFAALVRRHGPMVLGVCRRILRNNADADDAFQATFLVLSRKAAALGPRDGLGGFLHAIAFNVARKLRHANLRRAGRETPITAVAEPPQSGTDAGRDELFALLDEELLRLPERYRVPIVLCDLEGATRKEAAARLGWPEGTVAGRLSRARAMLADRLAARGVAPAAGVVVAVLAEPATASPGLVAATVRTVTDSAAPRIVELCEGVISAMFAKKLRTVVAVLFAGLAVVGIAGLFQFATAQPGPKPADPLPGPAPVANAVPTADGRGLTVLPLKKLDPEATAKVIADGYKGKGVTVAAVPNERLLLLYADQKVATEIQDLLKKLGEETQHAPQVIRLTGANSVDVARGIDEMFNGPATDRKQRVTVVPLANANALLVYASPADVLTVRKLLGTQVAGDVTPEPPKSAPEPKRYTVNFRSVPWADVLDWFAKESGLTPVYTVKPTGTVTLTPPKDRQFTLGEVVDLLNEALIQQKFILIRRTATFTLHPADERIDPTLIPRIELSELKDRGKTELVQVLMPLKTLAVEDTAPEVQKMLTPFGAIASLAKTNTLVIVDTAGNINRIYQTLRQVEEGTGDDRGDSLTHKLKYKKAKEVAEILKTLLADKTTPATVDGAVPKAPSNLYDQYGRPYGGGSDPRNPPRGGGDGAGRAKTVTITVDEKANSVTVTGPPEKIALAKKLLEEIDKPAKPGDPPITLPDPELRRYSVAPGTADAVAKALQTSYPSLRVVAIPAANEVLVLGTPAEHMLVTTKLAELAPGGKKGP